ncbi:MAG: DNA polymerase I [Clostridia bacterium]|nr:DNA polymerase I [Clostridia bacterium]
MSLQKLMLIDGNSILNRAFYGLQGRELLKTSDGLYTNAIFGFINILYKYLDEEKPQYLCVAFDLKAPTFRHKEFDGYKANRKGMPSELAMQVPVLKEVLDAMNIPRLEYEGYEADDIIGSVSYCAEKKGFKSVIVTGDRDALQLIGNQTRVKLPTTRGGKTETDEYDTEKLHERYGVTPAQFIDVKGLMGDASDNIPGVPGIGEKTAVELIKSFGSIENLYENIDLVEKKGVREKLAANKELAFMSKKLATIERQMPWMCDIEDLIIKNYDEEKLFELFKRLEFKSFIDKFKLGSKMPQKEFITKNIECVSGIEDVKGLKEEITKNKVFSLYYLMDRMEEYHYKLTGISITWEADKTKYIDLQHTVEEDSFLEVFKDVFEDEGIKKIGHDMKLFMVYLKNKGIMLKGLGFDTMIGAYIINPSKDTYTVSELAEEYLGEAIEGVEVLSGKGKNFTFFKDMPLEKISAAAGLHSEAVFRVWDILDNNLKENNQSDLYFGIELPLVEVLADMEYWGFKVNVEELKRFSSELQEKIDVLVKDIYDLAGEEFNINSTKQLGTILFEKLKLPALKKTKTGYSTDAEVLEQLESSHKIVSSILLYRQLVKLKSTYVEGLLHVIHPSTGKIHSSFNQTVTVTGRISSTEPNLQNIPIKLEMGRKIRKVFVPSDPDYILLDADYSQIELRVLAHITADENMISAFKENEDIHAKTASQVFGVSREEVTSLMRSRAKAVNFGIVYGIGDFSLSKDLGITRKEAKKYIEGYLSKYPNVKKYMQETVLLGKEQGYVTTLFNRRRYLPELKSSNFNIRSFGERIAMNTPIQGSAADIIKIAMVKVYSELTKRKLKSRLILQVHDELIVETNKDEKDEVKTILQDSMENAADMSVPLVAEVSSGDNWYEAKQ